MSWRAVVLALDEGDAFRSRVSVYLHPLGGRPIVWHVIHALAAVAPPPAEIVVLHHAGSPVTVPHDVATPVVLREVTAGGELLALRAALGAPGVALLIRGSAPLVTPPTLARLLRAAERAVAALSPPREEAEAIAVAGEGAVLAAADDPRHLTGALRVAATSEEELIRVSDRHTLSDAAVALRDRLVHHHEANGVSFILPATTWLDVDVLIGADTVVYPGAVLEGRTEIGAECVIGPHTRIAESSIGRGAELKGWNYVVRTSIRNHAVLEPYVRRGYD